MSAGSGGSSSGGWLPEMPTEEGLPDKLNPKEVGILSFMLNLVIWGIGAIVAVLGIGVASIPAGSFYAIQNLLDAVRTWTTAFIEAFFQPFQLSVACLQSAGSDCQATFSAVKQTGLAVQAFGVLGFAAAMVAVGAILYVTSVGVRTWLT